MSFNLLINFLNRRSCILGYLTKMVLFKVGTVNPHTYVNTKDKYNYQNQEIPDPACEAAFFLVRACGNELWF